jgi:CRP-like cAMP-binding protein
MPSLHEYTTPAHSTQTTPAVRNRLLATLPADEYARIAPHLQAVTMKAKHVFHRQGAPIRDVYFPGGGACSLMKVMQDGRSAQVGTIGSEGIVGAGVFFGDDLSTTDALVQVADGGAHAMPVEAFLQEMGRRNAFYNVVIRYSQALSTQIMQTTVCNGLHSAEQRCCRWLLTTHDRVAGDEFVLTQQFLAMMLGVRRPTVTLIASKLQLAGLISYRRGYVTITDRAGLEQAACECYGTVTANFARLLPELRTAM